MSAGTASLCSTLLFVSFLVFVSADQKNITAESGQDVTLTCRAPNNNIIAVEWSRDDLRDKYVLWYQNGRSPDEHQFFKNRVDLQDRQMKDGDVSLILKNVTINDTGTYECHVFMRGTSSWKSISIVYLTVVDPPDQKNITAESGQNVTLTCRAPNNNILVKWSTAVLQQEYAPLYQDEQFDRSNQHPSFKNRVDLQDRQMKDGDVSLILKDVTIDDAGTYECRVLMKETRSWKYSFIFLSVCPSDLPGGFIGLILAVLLLFVTIIVCLIYINYKLSRYLKECFTQNNQALQTDKDRQE
ncbi:neural cell adhesion molecule 2-like [Oreochromis niloticus]|uniref:neural cell adhesion molecule 2-like n=1 Tax=Oreochromis niloticus TaxID=8128 RepID=UPI000904D984|nr:neural cell adhesion molecule 2-like [Oreochromis niloticus]